MDPSSIDYPVTDWFLAEARLAQKPLLGAMVKVQGRMDSFKEQVKAFYFEVMLSPYRCPQCEGPLRMTGLSQCSCACGNAFDPTLEFQKSACCGNILVRRTYHYACSLCHAVVPSHFLFDERLFDSAYFREMMRESRRKAKEKKDELRRLLAESRSGALLLTENPCFESVDGFIEDLDQFINANPSDASPFPFRPASEFNLNDYRDHILSSLGWDSVRFSDIIPVAEDLRRDKAWRFITLVFKEHDRLIALAQEDDDIWVQRLQIEADA